MSSHKRKQNLGAVGTIGIIGGLGLAAGAGYLLYTVLWKKVPVAAAPSGGSGSGMPDVSSLIISGANLVSGWFGEPTGNSPCDFAKHFASLQSNFSGNSSKHQYALRVLVDEQRKAAALCSSGQSVPSATIACWSRLRTLAYNKDANAIAARYSGENASCLAESNKNLAGLGCWWCL